LEVFGQRHLIDETGDPRFRQPVFHLFDLALHLRIVNAGQRVALRDLVALVGHNLHHAGDRHQAQQQQRKLNGNVPHGAIQTGGHQSTTLPHLDPISRSGGEEIPLSLLVQGRGFATFHVVRVRVPSTTFNHTQFHTFH
jgi:hypothetical protein